MKDFLVITAFMDSGDMFRRRNVVESVERTLAVFTDADVVIAEQGSSEWLREHVKGCEIESYGTVGNFSKTTVMNRAIRARPGYRAYVMIDADVLVDETIVAYIREHYGDGSLVYPYGDCIYMHEPDTGRAIAGRPLLGGIKDHGVTQARQTGLCNVFTWDTFVKVGGYDDSFVGWGAEDDTFLVKCRRLVGPVVRNQDASACVLHMFHPKVNTRDYIEHGYLYVDNRVRCACVRRMSDEDLDSYVTKKVTLETLVDKYTRLGRLDIKIDWKYTPKYNIHMDATIYDIDRNGEMSMTKILDAMAEEDGYAPTIAYINDLYGKVDDLSDEQKDELVHLREKYEAALRQ